MAAIINNQGDIVIQDEIGMPTYIGTLKHGISYSTKLRGRKVARVTFQPNNSFISDEFFFIPEESGWELSYQHLMSREINPNLLKAYLTYFADANDYSPQAFINHVIREYFVKELGYQLPT